jgi:hypothetical protein
MEKDQEYYCILEQCWSTVETQILENYSDFSTVRRRIFELWEEHNVRQLERRNKELIEETNNTVILRNRWGGWLQVGVSKYGWLLIMKNAGEPLRVSHGTNQAEGYVIFLLPEWTEFEFSCLIANTTAEHVIENWLDKGELGDETIFQKSFSSK